MDSETENLQKLNLLINRAGAYSKFLADKLEQRQVTLANTKSRRKLPRQPRKLTGCTMRDYQIVGLEWLISLYENGLNGILADEMGLGKTLQTIAFLTHLIEAGTTGPFLIVAPLSTINNWGKEFKKFAPSLSVLLYHGTPKEREQMRKEYEFADVGQIPIIVTSYEICMKDQSKLKNIPWKYIVVDEGHRLKNLNCKLVRDLKSYSSANRLLLTGTPLQNNLAELWSLLNFLMPEIFNNLQDFEDWFEFEDGLENMEFDNNSESAPKSSMVSSLHQILKPFLLRRVKTDVMKDLPLKREYLLYAPMTPMQKEIYDAILRKELHIVLERYLMAELDPQEENSLPLEDKDELEKTSRRKRVKYAELEEDDFSPRETVLKTQNSKASLKAHVKKIIGNQSLKHMIMQLRKVCNHPFLFDIGLGQDNADDESMKNILAWSGKMLLLDRLLPALLEKDHKVLIFSQFTSMLDIIGEYLENVKDLDYCRIDGEVKLSERQEQIENFNSDKNLKVFLLSTRSGGLGINLTSADTVIIFDSDWNPQCDLQAQDRVHRIGQKRPVIVYRFVTIDSIERKILDRARSKRNLEKLVIHKNQFKGSKGYYREKGNTLVDLSEILQEETLAINTDSKPIIDESSCLPENILSQEELEKIMDRSAEAYTSGASNESKFDIVDAYDDANNALGALD